jgi:hypothetical protein
VCPCTAPHKILSGALPAFLLTSRFAHFFQTTN